MRLTLLIMTVFALGCPAMGAEQLEESEFEPMYQDLRGSLSGKPVGLFGSYGWGDGEWIRTLGLRMLRLRRPAGG